MNRDHGRNSKYDRNAQYVRDRRIRADKGNPIGGKRREPGMPAAFKLISLVCAVLMVVTGVYLLLAVFNSNGFRSHWRIVLISQFAGSLFDVLQSEQTNWQTP